MGHRHRCKSVQSPYQRRWRNHPRWQKSITAYSPSNGKCPTTLNGAFAFVDKMKCALADWPISRLSDNGKESWPSKHSMCFRMEILPSKVFLVTSMGRNGSYLHFKSGRLSVETLKGIDRCSIDFDSINQFQSKHIGLQFKQTDNKSVQSVLDFTIDSDSECVWQRFWSSYRFPKKRNEDNDPSRVFASFRTLTEIQRIKCATTLNWLHRFCLDN